MKISSLNEICLTQIFVFADKKEIDQLGKKKMHTLTPPWQRYQKVMSLSITTRMLQLPRLPTLIINLGFVQTEEVSTLYVHHTMFHSFVDIM